MSTSLYPPITAVERDNLTRPRAASALSHGSNRSRRSSGSGKMDLYENSRDKKRLATKADPRAAMQEAQPAAVALEDTTLEDLRRMQHKDTDGNLIVDPDRSNPTRHRLERPLDTIRSFQAAAEGTSSSRRSSYQSRPASQLGFDSTQNRRSGYYGGQGFSPSPQRARSNVGGYYRNSSYGHPRDSFAEEPAGSEMGYNNYQQTPPRSNPARHVSSPSYYNQTGVNSSPVQSHQQSYETMTSGSEDYNKSTNPSSQNSSFDRIQQLRNKQDDVPSSEYNSHFSPVAVPQHTGFMYNENGNNAQDIHGGPVRANGGQDYYQQVQQQQLQRQRSQQQQQQMQQQQAGVMAPPAPMRAANNPNKPIQLNSNGGGTSYGDENGYGLEKSPTKKRGSWLKRAFSKKNS